MKGPLSRKRRPGQAKRLRSWGAWVLRMFGEVVIREIFRQWLGAEPSGDHPISDMVRDLLESALGRNQNTQSNFPGEPEGDESNGDELPDPAGFQDDVAGS